VTVAELRGLPAECARCGLHASSDDSDGYLWVIDRDHVAAFCSIGCLVRFWLRRLGN
jgi:hypothetical protein